MPTKNTGGVSAAQASRVVKRAKPVRLRQAQLYNIKKDGCVFLPNATIDEVLKFMPDGAQDRVRITRRLIAGERDYDRLARPPDPPRGQKSVNKPGSYLW